MLSYDYVDIYGERRKKEIKEGRKEREGKGRKERTNERTNEGRLRNKTKIKPQHIYHLVYHPILCIFNIKTF